MCVCVCVCVCAGEWEVGREVKERLTEMKEKGLKKEVTPFSIQTLFT